MMVDGSGLWFLGEIGADGSANGRGRLFGDAYGSTSNGRAWYLDGSFTGSWSEGLHVNGNVHWVALAPVPASPFAPTPDAEALPSSSTNGSTATEAHGLAQLYPHRLLANLVGWSGLSAAVVRDGPRGSAAMAAPAPTPASAGPGHVVWPLPHRPSLIDAAMRNVEDDHGTERAPEAGAAGARRMPRPHPWLVGFIPPSERWTCIFVRCRERMAEIAESPAMSGPLLIRLRTALAQAAPLFAQLQAPRSPGPTPSAASDAAAAPTAVSLDLRRAIHRVWHVCKAVLGSGIDPFGMAVDRLVDAFQTSYTGLVCDGRLLRDAVAELHSMIDRLCALLMESFPDLARPEYELRSRIAEPALLSRMYTVLMPLYVKHSTLGCPADQDSAYRRGVYWLNQFSDVDLLQRFAAPSKLWLWLRQPVHDAPSSSAQQPAQSELPSTAAGESRTAAETAPLLAEADAPNDARIEKLLSLPDHDLDEPSSPPSPAAEQQLPASVEPPSTGELASPHLDVASLRQPDLTAFVAPVYDGDDAADADGSNNWSDDGDAAGEDAAADSPQRESVPHEAADGRQQQPCIYADAVQTLRSLGAATTPRAKLAILANVFRRINNTVAQYWKGQARLRCVGQAR